MTKLEEITTKIDELIKNESDTAKIEALAKLKNLSDEARNEETQLLKKTSELTENYKKLILNQPATKDAGKQDGGYVPPKEMPSFEDFFKAEARKLEKGK